MNKESQAVQASCAEAHRQIRGLLGAFFGEGENMGTFFDFPQIILEIGDIVWYTAIVIMCECVCVRE